METIQSQPDYQIGQTIEGYRIISILGSGSYSKVYKVEKDYEYFAMKLVILSKLNKDMDRQNALNEVRLLSSLDIPNVIKLYSTFMLDDDDTMCLILEFAKLGDIKQNIEKMIRSAQTNGYIEFVPEENIWRILIHCLRGLHELHSRNIVHRDIKSANLFIYDSNFIKLGDFNVSVILNEGFNKNQNGTPYYAAPEIWRGVSTDKKCDIWSLGCCIYELMTLRIPFYAANSRDLYIKILRGKYDAMPKAHPYSDELVNTMVSMLIVDPSRRPSAKELLECDSIKYMRKILFKDVDIISSFSKSNEMK